MGNIKYGEIISTNSVSITTQSLRVPISDRHTAAVFVSFTNKPSIEEIKQKWADFESEPCKLKLPSAPKKFLNYFEQDDRPQVKLDRNLENGIAISIGRLCEDLQYDYKFASLSHNTIRVLELL
ncbi:MAG: Asd/ArgC dimerization domain-containing protein [Mycoplasma sp.]